MKVAVQMNPLLVNTLRNRWRWYLNVQVIESSAKKVINPFNEYWESNKKVVKSI